MVILFLKQRVSPAVELVEVVEVYCEDPLLLIVEYFDIF